MDNIFGDIARAVPFGFAAGVFQYIETYGQATIILMTVVYLGYGIAARHRGWKENKNGS